MAVILRVHSSFIWRVDHCCWQIYFTVFNLNSWRVEFLCQQVDMLVTWHVSKMSVKLNEPVFCSTNVALNWFSGPLTVLLKKKPKII